MATTDPTTTPRIVSGLFEERRGGLTLLVHPEVPTWTVVNRLGTEIIRLADGRRDVKTIAARVARKYGRPEGEILADVSAFLDQLDQARMLVGAEPSVPVMSDPERLDVVSDPERVDVVSVNITDRCNLACRHCGVLPRGDGPSDLAPGRIRRLADEARELGVRELSLSGGEPMVRDDLFDLLRYATERFRVVHLFTNATLVDRDKARLLADLGVDIQISLDGASDAVHDALRGRGSFRKTIEGIEHLQWAGAGDRITLNYCVTSGNLDDVFPTLELAEIMGIPMVRFLPVSRIGRAKAAWSDMELSPEAAVSLYERLYRWAFTASGPLRIDPGLKGFHLRVRDPDDPYRTCPFGSRLLVDADGGIYPCPCLMTDEYRLHDAVEGGLARALRSERLARTRAAFTRRKDEIEACRTCRWRQLCRAACAGRVVRTTGELNRVDELCALRKRLYPEAIFALAERTIDPTRLEDGSWC